MGANIKGRDTVALGLLSRLRQRLTLGRWSGLRAAVSRMTPSRLRHVRSEARALRQTLDQLIADADSRISQMGTKSTALRPPPMADWSWRPALWRSALPKPGFAGGETPWVFDQDIRLYHDCPLSEIAARQIVQTQEGAPAPFGLCLDIIGFRGSFLSLVAELPGPAYQGPLERNLLAFQMQLSAERQVRIYARLNIKHGPNTEKIVRECMSDGALLTAEFDLAQISLKDGAVEKAWVDLFIDGPMANQIIFNDILFHRRPRAEL